MFERKTKRETSIMWFSPNYEQERIRFGFFVILQMALERCLPLNSGPFQLAGRRFSQLDGVSSLPVPVA